MVFIFFILFFLIFGQNLYCQFELVGEVGDVTGNKVFIENKGQFHSETDKILCYTKLDVGNVALTVSSVKFFTYGESNEVGSIKSSELIFKNVNGKAKIVYEDPVNTLYNFYLPHCPQGIVGVRGYKRIKLVNLYKDVNFIMEYLPNGQISAYFESYDINSLYQISVELDTKSKTRDGIALETDDAKLTFPPFVVNVLSAKNPGQYYIELNLQSNGSYAVSNISKYVGISGLREALIIDRYFGGNDDDQLWKIKKDKFERVIGIGSTRSKLFDPYTINNGKIVAGADVFIVAYNNALGANWVTIYGGNNDDLANDLDINNNTREIVFIGNTNSPDLPVSSNAYKRNLSYTGRQDAFVAKLSLDDGKIIWGTYFGGTEYDEAFSVAFAKDNYINFGGATYSVDLDVTPDAFQRNYNGGLDGFVAVLVPDGTRLYFSSYLGGNKDDKVFDMVTDANLNVIAVGYTSSDNFYAPAGNAPYQSQNRGGYDGFITKFDLNNRLIYSTYFGGSNNDELFAVIVNRTDEIIIVGTTFSDDLNMPVKSFRRHPINNQNASSFLVKFYAEKPTVRWATYVSSDYYDLKAMDIDCDLSNNNIFIAGWCASYWDDKGNPRDPNPFIGWFNDNGEPLTKDISSLMNKHDVFIGTNWNKKDPNYYATYGNSVAVLGDGTLFFAGKTWYKPQDKINILESGNSFIWALDQRLLNVRENASETNDEIILADAFTSGKFFLNNHSKDIDKIIVYDILGNELFQKNLYSPELDLIPIDLTSYPNGLYFVGLRKNGTIISIHKLIRY